MARTTAPFGGASRFDVLASDDHYEEEEEEVEEEPTAIETAKSQPEPVLSKSAKKRLAREAAKLEAAATKAAEFGADKVNGAVQAVTNGVNGVVNASGLKEGDGTDEAFARADNLSGRDKEEKREVEEKKYEASAQEEKDKSEAAAKGASAGKLSSASAVSDQATAVPASAPASSSKSHAKARSPTRSPTRSPIHAFAPDLPSLPTPSASVLPSNRKRKTPKDFSPSGPNDVPTPTSPSKNSVKFEDGIAPGEGKQGEKIIPAPAVVAKNRNAVERTIWTFIMIGGFITWLCLGHPYMILLVLLCQTLVYKEVTALFELRDQKKTAEDPWSKTLNWYFFVVTNYFLYGESIIYYFKHIVFVDAWFIPFARNHRFISFMLYTVGFVGFVANLQRQYLRKQFALFCWVHITLFLIVVSSHFIVNNILEGLIWFFIPASLVICNDVMAYVCGKLFGRTPLIKLSPKKTVEGFVGAYICTLIFGLAWGTYFMRFPYMICPARDLGTNVFSNVVCKPNPVFVYKEYSGIPYAPFQVHVLVMATFASLVAPFGGFFASGFKRAFNIKDFGHSIPGHGGMTDRMDCQFMMGMFSYVYYSSLVRVQHVDVGSIMQAIVTSLDLNEQLELLSDLKRFLEGQGVRV